MWIGTTALAMLTAQADENKELNRENARLQSELRTTAAMLAQVRSEQNWFKHRLNQVERERGQLIQAAIGVKIAVPEFVPTYERPDEALNEMPNLSTVGGDAVEESIGVGDGVADYTQLPGYQRG